MPEDESTPFNEAMYADVVQWINDNYKDISLPESVQQDLLRFNTLSDLEKEQLQANILALMPKRLEVLPDVLLKYLIGPYFNPRKELKELAKLSRRTYVLFQSQAVHSKFLDCRLRSAR